MFFIEKQVWELLCGESFFGGLENILVKKREN
jgi:hypothetical protein